MSRACSHRMSLNTSPIRERRRLVALYLLRLVCLLWLCATCALRSAAELQFDIFLGYDSVVREASWFPIAVEVLNDGPSFNGVVEISTGSIGADQVRQLPIELPTNTRKRLTVPIFAA